MLKQICFVGAFICALATGYAQVPVKGVVVDALTNEPLGNVDISVAGTSTTVLTSNTGKFTLTVPTRTDSLLVSLTGYKSRKIEADKAFVNIGLLASFTDLNEVIVSANRETQHRVEAPVAIQVISKTTLNDTKATRLDMLLNKVPGVFMVDLGNEQHSMSIRQPLGYNNLFLYMEDGIPIRTIGDFNHNALIEINQASLEKIEVIKGPASSLYGSEAVGGAINFITQAPSQIPTAKIQAEVGSLSYKRGDFFASNTYKKLGLYIGGYYATQNQDENLHNNFEKTALTLRADYSFNEKTKLVTTADYINYKTDQKGGLDSAHFYSKNYTSSYRFTYRKVNATRLKTTLTQDWNDHNKTSLTLFFRNSAIGQNPFYDIADIAASTSKASGQINKDAFNSYGAVIQHSKKFNFLKAKLIGGISADLSPATYNATFISVDKDNQGVYYKYTPTDSLLTQYDVKLLNTAVYAQFEMDPIARLKLVAAARYDRMDYKFDNHLPPGAFTGAPDAKNNFNHFTPKLGLTYDFHHNRGLYANYSVGFAPPNITDLYQGVKVPVLKPSSYTNYEVGGWFAFAGNKGYAELSLYQLNGTNEIVSVRLADGTYQNQNAGKTSHKGVEATIKYAPVEDILIRLGGTVAQHKYVEYTLGGKDYSNNIMSQAPKFIANSEITYKPSFLKGFRIAIEWQGLGAYYTDAQNSASYKGFNILNARAGYTCHGFEVWTNCINLADAVYATTVEKSSYGTSYRPGQLRTINTGISYYFNKKN
jgi:iron complex outermembrane receptor protein